MLNEIISIIQLHCSVHDRLEKYREILETRSLSYLDAYSRSAATN